MIEKTFAYELSFFHWDVSKDFLDAGLLDIESTGVVHLHKVSNSDAGITELLCWLQQYNGFALRAIAVLPGAYSNMGFSAMLAEEYMLIVPFAYHL